MTQCLEHRLEPQLPESDSYLHSVLSLTTDEDFNSVSVLRD